ncbi:MAG TPA: metal-sensitive transcriptional regulator, partial [Acidimicrobiales bacterium]
RMVELAQRPMPTSRVTHASNELVIRLRRVEGQVRGIQRMVTEGAPCSEVLTQLAAARRALDATGLALLDTRLHECLDQTDRGDAAELVTAVERFVRR